MHAIPGATFSKTWTLIEFAETPLCFQKTEGLSPPSTWYRERAGPRASSKRPALPASASLPGKAAVIGALVPKERKLALLWSRTRRRHALVFCKSETPTVRFLPQSRDNQPSTVLFSCPDRGLDGRLISFLDFVLNSFLQI